MVIDLDSNRGRLFTIHPSAILRIDGSEVRKQGMAGFIRDLRATKDRAKS